MDARLRWCMSFHQFLGPLTLQLFPSATSSHRLRAFSLMCKQIFWNIGIRTGMYYLYFSTAGGVITIELATNRAFTSTVPNPVALGDFPDGQNYTTLDPTGECVVNPNSMYFHIDFYCLPSHVFFLKSILKMRQRPLEQRLLFLTRAT